MMEPKLSTAYVVSVELGYTAIESMITPMGIPENTKNAMNEYKNLLSIIPEYRALR
jgi:hypothetical protein